MNSTTTSITTSSDSHSKSGGMSTGAIAAVVIVVVLSVALLCTLAYRRMRRVWYPAPYYPYASAPVLVAPLGSLEIVEGPGGGWRHREVHRETRKGGHVGVRLTMEEIQ